MKIIDFNDYKTFVRSWINALPRRGRGYYMHLSRLLRVNTSMITHIFKGDAQLTIEQALLVAEDLGLSSLEQDYFLNLVQIERAGNISTKTYFEKKLKEKREQFLLLSARVENTVVIEEKDQATFYSHWYFSAIRLLTAVPQFQQPKAIATELGLSLKTVNYALEFLVRTNLCTFDGSRYRYGPAKTFLERESVFVARHHANWRQLGMLKQTQPDEHDFSFTCPTVISSSDFMKIREEILRLIEKFYSIADPSPSEELVCLNIDWFKMRRSSN